MAAIIETNAVNDIDITGNWQSDNGDFFIIEKFNNNFRFRKNEDTNWVTLNKVKSNEYLCSDAKSTYYINSKLLITINSLVNSSDVKKWNKVNFIPLKPINKAVANTNENINQKANLNANPNQNSNSKNKMRSFVAWCPSEISQLGLYFGSLDPTGKMNMYLGFRSGTFTLSHDISDLECVSGKVVGNAYSSYTKGTGLGENRWSVTIGGTRAIGGQWLYFYTGIGYGSYKVFHEYKSTSGNSVWTTHTNLSVSGLEWEYGAIIDFNFLNFNIGFTSLSFDNWLLTYGVGFTF
jgi:hypothetical protein